MTRALTADEIAKYVHGVVAEPTSSFTSDELEAAMTIMEGKKPAIYQRGLIRNEDISQELKNSILKGEMRDILVSAGLAVEEDGVLVRADSE